MESIIPTIIHITNTVPFYKLGGKKVLVGFKLQIY